MSSVLIHLALRAHAMSAGLPPAFARENVAFTPPTDGASYAEEDFVEATRSCATIGPRGVIESTGLYVLRLHTRSNAGTLELRTLAGQMLAAFPKGWAQRLSDGSLVRTRNNELPIAGDIINVRSGYATCVVTIPWRHELTEAA